MFGGGWQEYGYSPALLKAKRELLRMDAVEFPDLSTPMFMLPDTTYVAVAPAITDDAITTAFFLTMATVI